MPICSYYLHGCPSGPVIPLFPYMLYTTCSSLGQPHPGYSLVLIKWCQSSLMWLFVLMCFNDCCSFFSLKINWEKPLNDNLRELCFVKSFLADVVQLWCPLFLEIHQSPTLSTIEKANSKVWVLLSFECLLPIKKNYFDVIDTTLQFWNRVLVLFIIFITRK